MGAGQEISRRTAAASSGSHFMRLSRWERAIVDTATTTHSMPSDAESSLASPNPVGPLS